MANYFLPSVFSLPCARRKTHEKDFHAGQKWVFPYCLETSMFLSGIHLHWYSFSKTPNTSPPSSHTLTMRLEALLQKTFVGATSSFPGADGFVSRSKKNAPNCSS
jgi:hypothetical protein